MVGGVFSLTLLESATRKSRQTNVEKEGWNMANKKKKKKDKKKKKKKKGKK